MRNVTKEIFLKAIVCPTWGWLIRHDEISEVPTLGERFRMEQGMEVGRRARKLYPGGILVEGKDIEDKMGSNLHNSQSRCIKMGQIHKDRCYILDTRC